jgi:flavorubredoxin
MHTDIAEIAAGIYRLSTFVPRAGAAGFTFNQFLIDAEAPLLFHYGQRSLFPLIVAAVACIVPLAKLSWTTCSHVEADEAGALNEWLAAAPNATPAHGQIGCNIWLTDMASRAPRALKNDEVLDLGGKRVRWLDTPHLPHNWDAGLILEETTGTLFCSDLFTQMGPAAATTESDIVGPAIAVSDRLPYMPATPGTAPTLRRLAALKPSTLALMHGPAFKGDGEAALNGLAEHYGGLSGQ